MLSWFRRRRMPERPRTSNGSSSFHLWWQDLPASSPVVAASVTLEVLIEPSVDDLYFWAVQASFTDDTAATHGAGHLGLQWNQRHPGHRAANWGGYGNVRNVRSILDGTVSRLPSRPDDRNTRDFDWRARTPYRLRIARGEVGWRGEIRDADDRLTVVRELLAGGDRLDQFVMWSEVFAPCAAPGIAVRWSAPVCEHADGTTSAPPAVRLTFPREGCPNTDTRTDAVGLVQETATDRRGYEGQRLAVP